MGFYLIFLLHEINKMQENGEMENEVEEERKGKKKKKTLMLEMK